jgi:hypothetical protein
VRIERRQHPANRAVNEAIAVGVGDVARFDGAQCGRECLVILRHAIVDGERSAPEDSANQRRYRDCEQNGGEGAITSHSGILTNKYSVSNEFWACQAGFFLTRHGPVL